MSPSPLTLLLARRGVGALATAAAVLWFLLADYSPAALTGLITLLFGFYVAYRLLLWIEGSRMTPARLRVGAAWALVGYDAGTRDFDVRPVRVYFLLLALQFAGLLIRPIAQWLSP